ncbi:MAG: hypothetical protein INF91_11755 [Alphaproteobacteria bacterium]|nr:hypothetical protein [Alphaproteobacteria bacterium]
MTAETEVRPAIGHEVDGPGRAYFDTILFDNILDALTELSAQMWTIQDRQYVLERVLEANGIDAGRAIEAWSPTPEDLAARRALREQVVARVFAGFLRRPDQTRP